MKRRIVAASTLCAFFLLAGSVSGQDSVPLLTLNVDKIEVPLEFGLAVTDADAEYLLDLNLSALTTDPSVLSLNLYEGVSMEARRFKTRYYDGRMNWSGDLYFPEILGSATPAGTIMLTDHGDHVTGIIHVDATEDDFRLLALDGEHRLVKLKRNRRQTCALQTDVGSSAHTPIQDSLTALNSQTMIQSSGTARFDVLIIVAEGESLLSKLRNQD